MSVRTVCPFCNSQVIETVAIPRVVCPRCGEASAPTAWEDSADAVATAAPVASPFPKRAFTISLTVSILALLGGLLYFQPWASPPSPIGTTGQVSTKPPPTLAGLKYLPATANVIIAAQPATMMRHLSDADSIDDRWDALGFPSQVTNILSGIEPSDVEEIVAGLTFALDKPLPGVTVFVKFRDPLHADVFKDKLKVEKKPLAGRAIYDTKSMLVATPLDDRTWLLGLSVDDLATADKPAGVALTAEIAKLEPSAYAWLVTDRRNWAEASPILKLEGGKKIAAKLARFRSATVQHDFNAGQKTRIELVLDSPATAEEVKKALAKKLPEEEIKVEDATVYVVLQRTPGESMTLLRELIDEVMK